MYRAATGCVSPLGSITVCGSFTLTSLFAGVKHSKGVADICEDILNAAIMNSTVQHSRTIASARAGLLLDG